MSLGLKLTDGWWQRHADGLADPACGASGLRAQHEVLCFVDDVNVFEVVEIAPAADFRRLEELFLVTGRAEPDPATSAAPDPQRR